MVYHTSHDKRRGIAFLLREKKGVSPRRKGRERDAANSGELHSFKRGSYFEETALERSPGAVQTKAGDFNRRVQKKHDAQSFTLWGKGKQE